MKSAVRCFRAGHVAVLARRSVDCAENLAEDATGSKIQLTMRRRKFSTRPRAALRVLSSHRLYSQTSYRFQSAFNGAECRVCKT